MYFYYITVTRILPLFNIALRALRILLSGWILYVQKRSPFPRAEPKEQLPAGDLSDQQRSGLSARSEARFRRRRQKSVPELFLRPLHLLLDEEPLPLSQLLLDHRRKCLHWKVVRDRRTRKRNRVPRCTLSATDSLLLLNSLSIRQVFLRILVKLNNCFPVCALTFD